MVEITDEMVALAAGIVRLETFSPDGGVLPEPILGRIARDVVEAVAPLVEKQVRERVEALGGYDETDDPLGARMMENGCDGWWLRRSDVLAVLEGDTNG